MGAVRTARLMRSAGPMAWPGWHTPLQVTTAKLGMTFTRPSCQTTDSRPLLRA